MGTVLRKISVVLVAAWLAGCPNSDPATDDDTTASDDDDVADDDATVDDDSTSDDDTVAEGCEGIDPMAQGVYHRETAEECPASREPLNPAPPDCGSLPEDECSSHEDCTAGPNGRCAVVDESMQCGCRYDECFSDEDCPSNTLCICAEQYPFELDANNVCRRASCRTGADCDTGLCMAEPCHCFMPAPGEALWIVGFSCATVSDECRNHEACYCDGDSERCNPDDDGAWVCSHDYMKLCE